MVNDLLTRERMLYAYKFAGMTYWQNYPRLLKQYKEPIKLEYQSVVIVIHGAADLKAIPLRYEVPA